MFLVYFWDNRYDIIVVYSFQSDTSNIMLSMKVDHQANDETSSYVTPSVNKLTATMKHKPSVEE